MRLGAGIADAEEVKAHPFFEGLDWKALERKEIPPPWKPNLANETDTSYFNKKYTYADIDEATPPVGIRIGWRSRMTFLWTFLPFLILRMKRQKLSFHPEAEVFCLFIPISLFLF